MRACDPSFEAVPGLGGEVVRARELDVGDAAARAEDDRCAHVPAWHPPVTALYEVDLLEHASCRTFVEERRRRRDPVRS